MEVVSPACSSGITGGGVPGGVVGVEVSQDERIILGVEKGFKVWVVVGRAGGCRRDVNVMNGEQVGV